MDSHKINLINTFCGKKVPTNYLISIIDGGVVLIEFKFLVFFWMMEWNLI